MRMGVEIDQMILKRKKGWLRLTWVTSILGGLLFSIFCDPPGFDDAIGLMITFLIFTWILYFSIIWIIRGFHKHEHEMKGIKSVGIYSDPATADLSILTLSRGYHDAKIYEGKFEDGKFTGKGSFILSDGRKYEGYIKDNKLHGQGTLYPEEGKDDLIWEGIFEDGKFCGS